MSTPPRIFLCGDALGRLNQLFKRVQSVNSFLQFSSFPQKFLFISVLGLGFLFLPQIYSVFILLLLLLFHVNKSSGPFDALLCVGQFFPDSGDGIDEVADYVEGRCSVPVPTYFTGDYGAGAARFLNKVGASDQGFKMDGIEVCANLYWLKGSGKFSLQGLSVVYLSGRKSPDVGGIDAYSEDDVDVLRALADDPGIVDIFMTNEWPSGVSNGADTSNVHLAVSDPSSSDPVVAELAAKLKPRFRFTQLLPMLELRGPSWWACLWNRTI